MTADARYEVTDKPSADVGSTIEHGLNDHIRQVTGYERRVYAILARDETGTLVAGLTSSETAGRYYVIMLWVTPERRGQGLGRILMNKAEEEARRLDCERIYVDTSAFQAPGFYTKLGYEAVATVKDFIKGYDRIFFEKDLTKESPFPLLDRP